MRQYLWFIILAGSLSLSGCSKEDDQEPATTYSILGEWTLTLISPAVFSLNCPEESVISFHEGGSADWTLNSENYNCVAQHNTGTWAQNSPTEYTLVVPEFGTMKGTVSFSSENAFSFISSFGDMAFTLFFEK